MAEQWISRFSGHDPASWIDSVDGFFIDFQIPYSQQIGIASRFLDGAAELWAKRHTDLTNWCAFSYLLLWEFDPTTRPLDFVEEKIAEVNSAGIENEFVEEEVDEFVDLVMTDLTQVPVEANGERQVVCLDLSLDSFDDPGYSYSSLPGNLIDFDSIPRKFIYDNSAHKMFDEMLVRDVCQYFGGITCWVNYRCWLFEQGTTLRNEAGIIIYNKVDPDGYTLGLEERVTCAVIDREVRSDCDGLQVSPISSDIVTTKEEFSIVIMTELSSASAILCKLLLSKAMGDYSSVVVLAIIVSRKRLRLLQNGSALFNLQSTFKCYPKDYITVVQVNDSKYSGVMGVSKEVYHIHRMDAIAALGTGLVIYADCGIRYLAHGIWTKGQFTTVSGGLPSTSARTSSSFLVVNISTATQNGGLCTVKYTPVSEDPLLTIKFWNASARVLFTASYSLCAKGLQKHNDWYLVGYDHFWYDLSTVLRTPDYVWWVPDAAALAEVLVQASSLSLSGIMVFLWPQVMAAYFSRYYQHGFELFFATDIKFFTGMEDSFDGQNRNTELRWSSSTVLGILPNVEITQPSHLLQNLTSIAVHDFVGDDMWEKTCQQRKLGGSERSISISQWEIQLGPCLRMPTDFIVLLGDSGGKHRTFRIFSSTTQPRQLGILGVLVHVTLCVSANIFTYTCAQHYDPHTITDLVTTSLRHTKAACIVWFGLFLYDLDLEAGHDRWNLNSTTLNFSSEGILNVVVTKKSVELSDKADMLVVYNARRDLVIVQYQVATAHRLVAAKYIFCFAAGIEWVFIDGYWCALLLWKIDWRGYLISCQCTREHFPRDTVFSIHFLYHNPRHASQPIQWILVSLGIVIQEYLDVSVAGYMVAGVCFLIIPQFFVVVMWIIAWCYDLGIYTFRRVFLCGLYTVQLVGRQSIGVRTSSRVLMRRFSLYNLSISAVDSISNTLYSTMSVATCSSDPHTLLRVYKTELADMTLVQNYCSKNMLMFVEDPYNILLVLEKARLSVGGSDMAYSLKYLGLPILSIKTEQMVVVIQGRLPITVTLMEIDCHTLFSIATYGRWLASLTVVADAFSSMLYILCYDPGINSSRASLLAALLLQWFTGNTFTLREFLDSAGRVSMVQFIYGEQQVIMRTNTIESHLFYQCVWGSSSGDCSLLRILLFLRNGHLTTVWRVFWISPDEYAMRFHYQEVQAPTYSWDGSPIQSGFFSCFRLFSEFQFLLPSSSVSQCGYMVPCVGILDIHAIRVFLWLIAWCPHSVECLPKEFMVSQFTTGTMWVMPLGTGSCFFWTQCMDEIGMASFTSSHTIKRVQLYSQLGSRQVCAKVNEAVAPIRLVFCLPTWIQCELGTRVEVCTLFYSVYQSDTCFGILTWDPGGDTVCGMVTWVSFVYLQAHSPALSLRSRTFSRRGDCQVPNLWPRSKLRPSPSRRSNSSTESKYQP